ncbi:MAG: aspartate carbamoyltransferase catalytic subunit [Verrucomicrobiota bacterium]|nr:aspartate carbamoyltransferase catalytic subunit [Bacteroidota bacterium]MEC8656393.1 aspartate carbamoyltransferase catalytic subunit [Verrucomicrobiota bacterium]MEC8791547.1 aspartate carbamoyltransferase catalytic subunit [Verrucomicrobiota bacterium]|tara:strand:- start:2350 stop:3282 length:933 start_codon:yes stop_codon:yes gene_type:complete
MKSWSRKSLLGLEDMNREEIICLLDKAKEFQKVLSQKGSVLDLLKGKRIINLFMEPSTRTRVAFEVAAKTLSADIISIAESSSSLTKGETLRDTALNIQALGADAIVIRHSSPGSALFLSKTIDVPIINAGDGAHEHPSQALLDIFTLRENLGALDGKKITILGDILFSRVARSNLWGLKKLGASVTFAGPSTLVPEGFEKLGAKVTHNLHRALENADAVMLLRIQHERQSSSHFPSLSEYTKIFGLSSNQEKILANKTLILHPGPINRGVEIDSTLADCSRSLILEQVSNGVAVRMAILYLCCMSFDKK